MSGKEMRFQVPPKTFRFKGWIMQRMQRWQWVPNRRTGDWERPGVKCAATKQRNIQFATAGRMEMAVRKTSKTGTQQSIDEVPRTRARYRKTPMNIHWTRQAAHAYVPLSPDIIWHRQRVTMFRARESNWRRTGHVSPTNTKAYERNTTMPYFRTCKISPLSSTLRILNSCTYILSWLNFGLRTCLSR